MSISSCRSSWERALVLKTSSQFLGRSPTSRRCSFYCKGESKGSRPRNRSCRIANRSAHRPPSAARTGWPGSARFVLGWGQAAPWSIACFLWSNGPAEVFLNSYLASARSDLTTHLAFQKAAICLEHAKHDVHKQAPGWPERAEATLDEGLRVLEEGVEVE